MGKGHQDGDGLVGLLEFLDVDEDRAMVTAGQVEAGRRQASAMSMAVGRSGGPSAPVSIRVVPRIRSWVRRRKSKVWSSRWSVAAGCARTWSMALRLAHSASVRMRLRPCNRCAWRLAAGCMESRPSRVGGRAEAAADGRHHRVPGVGEPGVGRALGQVGVVVALFRGG